MSTLIKNSVKFYFNLYLQVIKWVFLENKTWFKRKYEDTTNSLENVGVTVLPKEDNKKSYTKETSVKSQN